MYDNKLNQYKRTNKEKVKTKGKKQKDRRVLTIGAKILTRDVVTFGPSYDF